MNGVRRLFHSSSSSSTTAASTSAATSSTTVSTEPLTTRQPSKDSWLPLNLTHSSSEIPDKSSTSNSAAQQHPSPPALSATSILEQRPVQSPEPLSSTPGSSPNVPKLLRSQLKSNGHISDSENVRDDLLIGLLASEAVVECRHFQTLDEEELKTLKKEQQLLTARLHAVSKKLKLETKIRDAALSLNKVAPRTRHGSQNIPPVSASEVEGATRKVETVQKDLWSLTEKSHDVSRRLLEHHAGILSAALTNAEAKHLYGGNNGGGGDLSPTSTSSNFTRASSVTQFGSAHFYAGHSNASVPMSARAVEKQLREVSHALEQAKSKQADAVRDMKHLQLEKAEREAVMSMELQSAEETIATLRSEASRIAGLEGQVDQLMEEREAWERARRESENMLREWQARIQDLESQLASMKHNAGLTRDGEEERSNLELRLSQERQKWEIEKQDLELSQAEEIARLDDELASKREDVEEGLHALRLVINTHRVPFSSRNESIQKIAQALSSHLENLVGQLQVLETTKNKLEGDVRNGFEAREQLNRELAVARQDKEDLWKEIRSLELKVKNSAKSSTRNPSGADGLASVRGSQVMVEDSLTSQLKSLWEVLPSPEARASKLDGRSPTKSISSLSELDVRSLRALYDPRHERSDSPVGEFSVEGFTKRVQALIADDRALIERLIRFAQSHELLKTNAERAQRLARESSQALETYQKQVNMLQDRNSTLDGLQISFNTRLAEMERSLEQAESDKRDLEAQAAEQAEQLLNLTEANNALSAKTLNLAAEPEAIRVRMEAQLREARQALRKVEGELEAIRTSEQVQRAALMDEVNTMQTENSRLREALRTEQRKNSK